MNASNLRKNNRRNRIAINLEDVLFDAFAGLADAEGVTISELGRSLIIERLLKEELLPDATMARLAGVVG